MDKLEKLTNNFWNNNYNCAQSSACGLLSYYGLEQETKILEAAMSAFGGGMGERSICGGVTGTLAALGILLKKKNASKEQYLKAIKQFKKAIKDTYNLNCEDILVDFIDEAGNLNNVPERREKCTEVVLFSVKTAKDIIESI